MYSLEGLQHDCHHALLQLSEHTVGKVLADFAVYATDDANAKLNVTLKFSRAKWSNMSSHRAISNSVIS